MSDYVFQAQLGKDGQFGFVNFEPATGVKPEAIPAMLNDGSASLDEENCVIVDKDGTVLAEIHDMGSTSPSIGEADIDEWPVWTLHPDDRRYLSERN